MGMETSRLPAVQAVRSMQRRPVENATARPVKWQLSWEIIWKDMEIIWKYVEIYGNHVEIMWKSYGNMKIQWSWVFFDIAVRKRHIVAFG